MKTTVIKQIESDKDVKILQLSKMQKLVVSSHKTIDFLNVQEISHLTAENNYTTIHLIQGTSYLSSKTLAHYASDHRLKNFLRIHHSHLINPAYITQIIKGDQYEVKLISDIMLPISRSNRQLINNYITSIL